MVDQAGNKTGGRKRGTPNRSRAEVQDIAKRLGIDPVEYMLSVVADPTTEPERRDRMAAAVAPYVRPKLQSIDHAGSVDHVVTHEEWVKRLEEARRDRS